MNTWQLCRAIQARLRARKWLGSGSLVFAKPSVLVTLSPTLEVIQQLRMPAALISPGSAVPDPLHKEDPDFLQQGISIALATAVSGDPWGEAPLMGRNRQSKTNSDGRGLLEIETEVAAAIAELGKGEQIVIQFRGANSAIPQLSGEDAYIVFREYAYEADVTTFKTWESVVAFSATLNVADVDLAWTAPDNTTDLVEYVVRRNSGVAAPMSPTEGTDIPLVSPLDVSVTDTAPGSGTWSYSIFAGYDEEGGSSGVDFSVPSYKTVVVP